MDSALLIKVAGIGLLVAVAHQILTRAGREEQAMLLSVTGTVVVLQMLTEKIGDLFNSIRSIFGI